MSPFSTMALADAAVSSGLGINWSVLGIVLAGVAVLMFAIRAVGLVASRSIEDKARAAVPAPLPSATSGKVTPELVAILTAAATAVLGNPVRLVAISESKLAAHRSWSKEGRREIYMSHRIR